MPIPSISARAIVPARTYRSSIGLDLPVPPTRAERLKSQQESRKRLEAGDPKERAKSLLAGLTAGSVAAGGATGLMLATPALPGPLAAALWAGFAVVGGMFAVGAAVGIAEATEGAASAARSGTASRRPERHPLSGVPKDRGSLYDGRPLPPGSDGTGRLVVYDSNRHLAPKGVRTIEG